MQSCRNASTTSARNFAPTPPPPQEQEETLATLTLSLTMMRMKMMMMATMLGIVGLWGLWGLWGGLWDQAASMGPISEVMMGWVVRLPGQGREWGPGMVLGRVRKEVLACIRRRKRDVPEEGEMRAEQG